MFARILNNFIRCDQLVCNIRAITGWTEQQVIEYVSLPPWYRFLMRYTGPVVNLWWRGLGLAASILTGAIFSVTFALAMGWL